MAVSQRKAFQLLSSWEVRLGVDAVSRRAIIFTVMLALSLLSLRMFPVQSFPIIDNDAAMASWPGGLIIDHTCIDIDMIPSEWIESAQDNVRIHYAHTSHGGQITEGLSIIESDNSSFHVSIDSSAVPTEADALCILDGNPPETYITPDLYWQGSSAVALTQNTLDNNPSVTVSFWSWCTQLDSYSEEDVQQYLDTMSSLEAANLGVTFVYMTGNAQATDESGYNRWLRNEQIRQYCRDNNKVLFDFADLDCWSNGDHSTYDYIVGMETLHIPVEHPNFNGDEAAHTTYASCEQKGYAFWWLVTMLAGWNAPEASSTTGTTSSTSSSHTGTTTTQLFSTDVILYAAIAGAIILVGAAAVRRFRS
jgi:hypothetical protein